MKIIHEISAYLHAEGFVSDEMMLQLRAQGFVPHPSETEEPFVIEPTEREFEHECPRDRMPLCPSPKLATLSARELDSRIAERLGSWRELATLRAFGGFLPGASAVKSDRDLEAICGVIHRSSRTQKLDAIVASVRARKPDLGDLFSLLRFRGYRDVLASRDARGPAVNAYVAAIASVGRGDVGTYGWVLKQPAVRAVFHLVEAQREVARAIADLVSHHSELLPTAIRRSLSIYWPLVLVHSARLYDPKRPSELPGRGRHHPRRACPSRNGWADAWTLAMQIDELSTRAFLESLVGSNHWEGPAPEPRFSPNRRGDMGLLGGTLNDDKLTPFACPPAWDLHRHGHPHS